MNNETGPGHTKARHQAARKMAVGAAVGRLPITAMDEGEQGGLGRAATEQVELVAGQGPVGEVQTLRVVRPEAIAALDPAVAARAGIRHCVGIVIGLVEFGPRHAAPHDLAHRRISRCRRLL